MRVGRTRGGRAVGRYLMCVHVRENVTQIAVLEGRALIEHYVSRPEDDANQIDGNVYTGRVQNVLPGMEAAFVDIGTPKNAVLYRGDVRYDRGDLDTGDRESVRIENLLRPGQVVTCQVTKNPIGTKGARLTQEVSLPGRFVVLVPNSDTYGISKRLPDEERKRLRRILDDIKPEAHGLIVRTAAAGVSADELSADVRLLSEQWKAIETEAAARQGAGAAVPGAVRRPAHHPRGVQRVIPRHRHRRPANCGSRCAITWPTSAPAWPTASSCTTRTRLTTVVYPSSSATTCTSRSIRRWTARCGCRRAARSSSSGPRR